MSFDLAALKASLTLDHEVEHPTVGMTGWVITLAGDGHPATKAALRTLLDKRAKRKVSNSAIDEQDGIGFLVARVLGWKGLKEGESEVLFSPAKAEELFTAEGLEWLKRQVLTALGDDALFFKA